MTQEAEEGKGDEGKRQEEETGRLYVSVKCQTLQYFHCHIHSQQQRNVSQPGWEGTANTTSCHE